MLIVRRLFNFHCYQLTLMSHHSRILHRTKYCRHLRQSAAHFASRAENAIGSHEYQHYLKLAEEDSKIYETSNHLFQEPKNRFLQFFAYCQQNIDQNYRYEISFRRIGPDHSSLFHCEIDIFGPFAKEFVGTAATKKKAEAAAILKAMMELYQGNHISYNGEPTLKQAKHRPKDVEPLFLSLTQDLTNELQGLIDHYNKHLHPKLEESKNETDEDEKDNFAVPSCLDAEDVTPEVQDLITGSPLRQSLNRARNSDSLQKKLVRTEKLRNSQDSPDLSLPISHYRKQLLRMVEEHPVVILQGGTGCGKSTQVPQMLLDDWIEKGKGADCNVIVSQPRRVAASSLASWVSSQRDPLFKDSVGCKMRMHSDLPKRRGGAMVFYTSGTLRQVMRFNPQLEGVSHLVLDEVHERFLDSDLMLVLIKRILTLRKDLRVIIMSATANTRLLQDYFGCSSQAVLEVEGRSFENKAHFLEDSFQQFDLEVPEGEGYVGARDSPHFTKDLYNFIKALDKKKPAGSVLVFLPGWKQIKLLKEWFESDPDCQNLLVVPLHSMLPLSIQERAFEQPPQGTRKVILSTNIAETSITINDIVYVIDTGVENELKYLPNRRISSFGQKTITKSNMKQRAGRAGRVRPGEVFHLYSEDTYHAMNEYPDPQILRMSLESAVLHCKLLLPEEDTKEFMQEMLDVPPPEAIQLALNNLESLGLVTTTERGLTLTPLGKVVAAFPLECRMAKTLIYASLFSCADLALNYICLEDSLNKLLGAPTSTEMRSLKMLYGDNSSDITAICRMMENVKEFDGIPHLVDPQDCSPVREVNRDFYDNFTNLTSYMVQELNRLLGEFHLSTFHQEGLGEESGGLPYQPLLGCFLASASSVVDCYYDGTKLTPNKPLMIIEKKSVLSKYEPRRNEDAFVVLASELLFKEGRRKIVLGDGSILSPWTLAMFYSEISQSEIDKIGDFSILETTSKDVKFIVDSRIATQILEFRRIFSLLLNLVLEENFIDGETKVKTYEFFSSLCACAFKIVSTGALGQTRTIQIADLFED